MTPDCFTLMLCLQTKLQKITCPDGYLRAVHFIRTWGGGRSMGGQPGKEPHTKAASPVGPVLLGRCLQSVGCSSVVCWLSCCKRPGRDWA